MPLSKELISIIAGMHKEEEGERGGRKGGHHQTFPSTEKKKGNQCRRTETDVESESDIPLENTRLTLDARALYGQHAFAP